MTQGVFPLKKKKNFTTKTQVELYLETAFEGTCSPIYMLNLIFRHSLSCIITETGYTKSPNHDLLH